MCEDYSSGELRNQSDSRPGFYMHTLSSRRQLLFNLALFILNIQKAVAQPQAMLQSANFAAEMQEGMNFVRWKWTHLDSGQPLSFNEAVDLLSSTSDGSSEQSLGEEFRGLLLTALRKAPYAGFFWEHPPINAGSSNYLSSAT